MTSEHDLLSGNVRESAGKRGQAAEPLCPVCTQKYDFLVQENGRFQVWHSGRLFPCGGSADLLS